MQVHMFYPDYLNDLYRANPGLLSASFMEQMCAIVRDGFSAIHIFAPYMSPYGYEAMLAIANNPMAQQQWLKETGVAVSNPQQWVHEVVQKQVEVFKPDVLYLPEPVSFDSKFIRRLSHRPSLVVGWKASSIPPGTDWSEFDVILSSLSAAREAAIKFGAKSAEHFYPGIPRWVSDAVADIKPQYDVSFSGTWTTHLHGRRNAYLDKIAVASQDPAGPFSCGFYISGQLDALTPQVAKFNQGGRFGLAMHKALRSGRIVFDGRGVLEAKDPSTDKVQDIAKNETANMRIFEAVGSGSFLLTEHYDNLSQYFIPGKEIETFRDEKELIDKIRYYLAHPDERERIARAGHEKCLSSYSIESRAAAFDRIIRSRLGLPLPVSRQQPAPVEITDAPATAEQGPDVYDQAYEYGWNNPNLRGVVWLCYKTPDFADNARRFFQGQEFQEAVNVLASLGKPPGAGLKVLDFGCGNGIASYSLSRMGYDVVGLDSSLGKLAGLGAARQLQGLDGVSFQIVHARAEKLGFADDTFDVVWIREALHHIHGLAGFLTDVKRILKPGGIICCMRDVVIWNEKQREHFFANHPFYHITHDEGCYYLNEYLDGFLQAGLVMEKVFDPCQSAINSYPNPYQPGAVFNVEQAKIRQQHYDLYTFFARKPAVDIAGRKTTDMQTMENGNVEEKIKEAFEEINAGKTLEGLEKLDALKTSGVQDHRLDYGRAIAMARLGRVEPAVAELRQLLDKYPDFRQAREILLELEKIVGRQSAQVITSAGQESPVPQFSPPPAAPQPAAGQPAAKPALSIKRTPPMSQAISGLGGLNQQQQATAPASQQAVSTPAENQGLQKVSLTEALKPAFYGPTLLTPSTLAKTAASRAMWQELLSWHNMLASDQYVAYVDAFYRQCLAQYGENWFYLDITNVLYAASKLIQPKNYLEIGVRRGRSCCAVVRGCPTVNITACDMWIQNYAGMENPGPDFVFAEIQKHGFHGHFQVVNGNSHEMLPQFFRQNTDKMFDMITVDGDHTEQGAIQDLRDVLPHLAVGGAIIFDDISHPAHPYLLDVWRRIVRESGFLASYEFTEQGYGVAFGIRIK